MKSIIFFLPIIFFFSFACRKTYTCECDVKSNTTTTSTPRNGTAAQTSTSESSIKIINQRPGVRKSDMHRTYNCNSRFETSTRNYTVTGTFGSTEPVIADVQDVASNNYDCVIK